MYQVKRKGGASYQVIDVTEHELSEYSETLKRDLRYAIGRHELRLDYQPVVSTTTGRINSVEALLRWEHPQRGLIEPAVLIPLAESSGDIVKIGQWVLERACIDRHRWEDKTGDRDLVMAVNVSAHQLMAPGFVPMVESILASTKTKPETLCLEITESAFVQDAQRALAVLSQLKTLGVQVALDDFGTGYSSLSYLMEFPVDIVKIDQRFIAKLIENDASRAIVAATIDLAHELKLLVVCEGVETAEQMKEVTALTSDYSQGFYFSLPLSAGEIDELTSLTPSAWTIAVPEPV
jgi:EAL domain-containing protein (putative c-di-GMP-specific phosphodiesterase class I)